jgi:hypothetical protein
MTGLHCLYDFTPWCYCPRSGRTVFATRSAVGNDHCRGGGARSPGGRYCPARTGSVGRGCGRHGPHLMSGSRYTCDSCQ